MTKFTEAQEMVSVKTQASFLFKLQCYLFKCKMNALIVL